MGQEGLDAAVGEEHAKFVPLAEGVGDRLAGEDLGQVFAPGKEFEVKPFSTGLRLTDTEDWLPRCLPVSQSLPVTPYGPSTRSSRW